MTVNNPKIGIDLRYIKVRIDLYTSIDLLDFRCKKNRQYLGWIRRQQLTRSCVLKGTNFNPLMKGKRQVIARFSSVS